MTQEELEEKIEMTPERRRNRICRYERGTRNPKDDRVEKMAEVLEKNEAMIKSYDFKDPMDIVYIKGEISETEYTEWKLTHKWE